MGKVYREIETFIYELVKNHLLLQVDKNPVGGERKYTTLIN